QKVAQILQAAGDRIKTAGDILDYGYFFTPDDRLEYEPGAIEKRLRAPGDADRLRRFAQQLAQVEPFEPAMLESMMHDFVMAEGIKLGDIIHAVRAAVTGTTVGLGMFDALAILGRESCLARIERALQYAV
ncbi:MAG TPA: glutamate--tRNA ligase, partial [Thermoguttaceae bacterium]|nr:glutamate--tRNA ligase [Thermoguttaceae bacterium]